MHPRHVPAEGSVQAGQCLPVRHVDTVTPSLGLQPVAWGQPASALRGQEEEAGCLLSFVGGTGTSAHFHHLPMCWELKLGRSSGAPHGRPSPAQAVVGTQRTTTSLGGLGRSLGSPCKLHVGRALLSTPFILLLLSQI